MHIPLKKNIENSKDYFCYKIKYSLNVRTLCDYKGIFLDVDITWPRSVHDACTYANFHLNKMLVEKPLAQVCRSLTPGTDQIPPLVLTDPAYPLLPNVMKEYSEDAYNEKAVFNQIVCAFGRLKARWQILNHPMDLKLEDIPQIIYSCFILHNLCELNGVPHQPGGF